MTEERLAELETLTARATPGPWFPRWGGEPGYVTSSAAGIVVAEIDADKGDDRARDDSKFIAAARTALPELLSEVRRLRKIEHAARTFTEMAVKRPFGEKLMLPIMDSLRLQTLERVLNETPPTPPKHDPIH